MDLENLPLFGAKFTFLTTRKGYTGVCISTVLKIIIADRKLCIRLFNV